MSSRRGRFRPSTLLAELPKSEAQSEFVARVRREIHRVIFSTDQRFSSSSGRVRSTIAAGHDYASRSPRSPATSACDQVMVVMRVYFEKPHATGGWKGG